MPSHKPLSTIGEHIEAYGAEIGALRRPNADTRRGSGYDIFGGTNAVLFTRQATRDRDLFRAIYFDDSIGDDVDVLLEERFNSLRRGAGSGTGTLIFERPSAGVGGAFHTGTRVAVLVPGADIRFVEISQETPYGAADVSATVPVRTVVAELTQPLSVTRDSGYLRLDDPIEDMSWRPISAEIGAGSDREKDAAYKARTKSERLANRVGYAQSISDACRAVGAEQIALFSSNYLGDENDHGINRLFVGFSSFVSTPDLVTRCRIAVDSWRVLGADLVVMGMTSLRLPVRATIRLWLKPNDRSRHSLSGAAAAAIVEYFNARDNAFAFRFSGMRSAVLKSLRTDVQSVDFSVGDPALPPVTEPVLSVVTFGSSIQRIFTTPSDVRVSIQGPA